MYYWVHTQKVHIARQFCIILVYTYCGGGTRLGSVDLYKCNIAYISNHGIYPTSNIGHSLNHGIHPTILNQGP